MNNAYNSRWFLFSVALSLSCFLGIPLVYADEGLERQLKSGDKNIHFSGKESDDVKIPKGVSISGDSPSNSVINGDVKMEDGSSLSNVTINAQFIGITVVKGASVSIKNVTVKGASDAGIFSESGGGTLTLTGSRITGNRKGMYILPGKNIILTNNEIVRNKEEGIDVRNKVSGVISGNNASDNGEGGAEIIVNNAKLSLTGNSFLQNKASGLALQYYNNTGSSGNIQVNENTFTGNGNFGITCGAPSGSKNRPGGFFANAAHLVGNVFGGGNRDGNISGVCGFVNAAAKTTQIDEADNSNTSVSIKDVVVEEEEIISFIPLEIFGTRYLASQKIMAPWLTDTKQCSRPLSSVLAFGF